MVSQKFNSTEIYFRSQPVYENILKYIRIQNPIDVLNLFDVFIS